MESAGDYCNTECVRLSGMGPMCVYGSLYYRTVLVFKSKQKFAVRGSASRFSGFVLGLLNDESGFGSCEFGRSASPSR